MHTQPSEKTAAEPDEVVTVLAYIGGSGVLLIGIIIGIIIFVLILKCIFHYKCW